MLEKSRFRILLFANGEPGIEALKVLEKSGYSYLVIPDPSDNGTQKNSLSSYCHKSRVNCIKTDSFSSPGFIEKISSFAPHIILSVQCRKILKPQIIELVNGESFNIHFSDLPRNRGCHPGVWHILNGDKYAGVTLHKLDEGIDTGCIIDKERKLIKISDTTESLYNWCTSKVPALIKRNLKALLNNKYKCIKQDESKASYYSRHSINFKENFIEWSRSSFGVSRFVQAFCFPSQQHAQTRFKNEVIEIAGVVSYKKSPIKRIPGTILNKSGSFFTVQTGDGYVKIKINKYPKETEKEMKPGKLFYK